MERRKKVVVVLASAFLFLVQSLFSTTCALRRDQFPPSFLFGTSTSAYQVRKSFLRLYSSLPPSVLVTSSSHHRTLCMESGRGSSVTRRVGDCSDACANIDCCWSNLVKKERTIILITFIFSFLLFPHLGHFEKKEICRVSGFSSSSSFIDGT